MLLCVPETWGRTLGGGVQLVRDVGLRRCRHGGTAAAAVHSALVAGGGCGREQVWRAH